MKKDYVIPVITTLLFILVGRCVYSIIVEDNIKAIIPALLFTLCGVVGIYMYHNENQKPSV